MNTPDGIEAALNAVSTMNDATIGGVHYKVGLSMSLEKKLKELREGRPATLSSASFFPPLAYNAGIQAPLPQPPQMSYYPQHHSLLYVPVPQPMVGAMPSMFVAAPLPTGMPGYYAPLPVPGSASSATAGIHSNGCMQDPYASMSYRPQVVAFSLPPPVTYHAQPVMLMHPRPQLMTVNQVQASSSLSVVTAPPPNLDAHGGSQVIASSNSSSASWSSSVLAASDVSIITTLSSLPASAGKTLSSRSLSSGSLISVMPALHSEYDLLKQLENVRDECVSYQHSTIDVYMDIQEFVSAVDVSDY